MKVDLVQSEFQVVLVMARIPRKSPPTKDELRTYASRLKCKCGTKMEVVTIYCDEEYHDWMANDWDCCICGENIRKRKGLETTYCYCGDLGWDSVHPGGVYVCIGCLIDGYRNDQVRKLRKIIKSIVALAF